MSEHLTLATATGAPLATLVFHVTMGVAALVSGYVAIAARKGGAWHRRSGMIYVAAMIAMGLTAVGISVYLGKDDIAGGAATAYLIFTGWTTVKPVRGVGRGAHIALMLFAFALAAGGFIRAFSALERPGNQIEGVPAGMMFFLNTIFLLAAIGDARVIRAGTIQGTRRLARHLWRMCFGLFIASGSFVAQLTKMTFIPGWMRGLVAILVLSAAPLVVLLYWMWRVRLRQNLRGVLTAKPIEMPRPA